jgi:glyoxylase-like metal-dependent hydrolase (beta-lactamase superfamily II)
MRTTLFLLLAASLSLQNPQAPSTWRINAVRYATIADFPVASLVAGADASRRADIAMMIWLLKGADGRSILFDAGFHGDQYIKHWKPRDFVRPDAALARLDIKPSDVTDVVVSHVHWDHLDGAGLFPRARVWLQKDEYEYYVGSDGRPKNRGIDERGATLLADLHREKRLRLVEGDGVEILPGVRVHTGGRHTYASQYVSVQTAAGPVVLASDNLYLYENLDRGVAIAQTFDAAANLEAQRRMRALVQDPAWIVPGHDPQVFARFPQVADGVVEIPKKR